MTDRVLHFAVRSVLPRVLRAARAVAPVGSTALVAGYPRTEGNAVETARALARRFDGTVVWVDAPPAAYLRAIGFTDDQLGRIRRVGKNDPRALWEYATASAVFFTHGLYGEPGVDRRKLTVNLWHGSGMKRNARLFPERHLRSAPSDYVVSCSRLWGAELARNAGMTTDTLICSGNPRTDQLHVAPDRNSLQTLGISADRPYVVWLPSYRRAAASGTMRGFTDSSSGLVDDQLSEQFGAVVDVLSDAGVTVVVKPHPLDAVARHTRGAVVLDDVALERAGLPLYTLLGGSAGLITDASSVWTDYLATDKPIGFFFPDRADYASGRGFYPSDVLDWLPGPMLETVTDVDAFAREVLAGGGGSSAQRDGARHRAGIHQTDAAADALLDALSAHGGRFASLLRPHRIDASVEGGPDGH